MTAALDDASAAGPDLVDGARAGEHQAVEDQVPGPAGQGRMVRVQHHQVAAGADGEVSDDELTALAAQLEDTFERIGSELDPAKVLRFAKKHSADDNLLNETIEIFGEHLSQGFLANLIAKAQEIAGSDELSEDEEDLLAQLVEAWQIEE